MKQEKFTVLIPTRERCDTLQHSLRTCVSQNYDNLEIVVSDNLSQDRTRDVVSSFSDPRIRYLNTGRRLSMSHNWEFALSHIKDGYVIVMGDDDGVLPNAIHDLNAIVQETGAMAINWILAFYGWPNSKYAWIRNKLKVPVGMNLQWRDSQKMLRDVIAFRRDYSELPMIYPFLVHRDCMTRASGGGAFIRSVNPDLYTGIAVAGVIDRYLYSERPYVLSGISSHSSGASFTNPGVDKRSTERFFSEENIPFHPRLSLAASMVILTAEGFLQAQEAVPSLKEIPVDLRHVVRRALRETSKLRSPAYENALKALVETCEKNDLGPDLRAMVENYTPRIADKLMLQNAPRLLFKKAIFDGAKLGLDNVYDATLYCKKVLDRRKAGHLFLKERVGFIAHQVARGLGPLFQRFRDQWGY